MKKLAWLIPLLLLALSSSFAASRNEVRAALENKFDITKRSLDGDIKQVGTVIYLTIPGITAARPVFAAKTIVVKSGTVVSEELSRDTSRQPLSVGEPMHIYSVQARENSVLFRLGTESKYPVSVLGGSMDMHLQTALEFEIDGGFARSTIEAILAEVEKAALTEQEAAERPEILSAAIEIRKNNAEAGEQRRLDKQRARTQPAQNEPQSAPTTTSSPSTRQTTSRTPAGQASNSQQEKTRAQLRTEELQSLADQKYATKWDAALSSSEPWENAADLLKYSPARTMAALAQGHKIVLKVREISFSRGSMVVEGLHPYTDIYAGIKEQVQREFGQTGGGWDDWFAMTASAGKDRYVSFFCKVDPAEAADLKPEGTYVLTATLED